MIERHKEQSILSIHYFRKYLMFCNFLVLKPKRCVNKLALDNPLNISGFPCSRCLLKYEKHFFKKVRD